jgi:hypothetical protein
LQQPPRPTISADIPSQQAAGQHAAGQPQEPNIQGQYVPMPPGPMRPLMYCLEITITNPVLLDNRTAAPSL